MSKKTITKIITWVCDKKDCGHRNTREILYDLVLNDDTCDSCSCRIHEPITIELAIRNNKKKKNGN